MAVDVDRERAWMERKAAEAENRRVVRYVDELLQPVVVMESDGFSLVSGSPSLEHFERPYVSLLAQPLP